MGAKLNWIRTLKVGDVVCDCCYRHRPIAKIENIYEPKSNSLAIGTFLLAEINLTLGVLMRDAICRMGGGMVAERVVYFADGTRCHATRCLDPTTNCLHE